MCRGTRWETHVRNNIQIAGVTHSSSSEPHDSFLVFVRLMHEVSQNVSCAKRQQVDKIDQLICSDKLCAMEFVVCVCQPCQHDDEDPSSTCPLHICKDVRPRAKVQPHRPVSAGDFRVRGQRLGFDQTLCIQEVDETIGDEGNEIVHQRGERVTHCPMLFISVATLATAIFPSPSLRAPDHKTANVDVRRDSRIRASRYCDTHTHTHTHTLRQRACTTRRSWR